MLVTPVNVWSTLGCAGSLRSRILTVSVGLSVLRMTPLEFLSGTSARPTSEPAISSLPAVASLEGALRFTKLGSRGFVTSTTVKPCLDAFWTYRYCLSPLFWRNISLPGASCKAKCAITFAGTSVGLVLATMLGADMTTAAAEKIMQTRP